MEYIDSDAEIIEGDEIITSGLSEYYPEGISVGYVKEIHRTKTDLLNMLLYSRRWILSILIRCLLFRRFRISLPVRR